MNYLNSVFVVLLVILVAIAAFGYLINESADQRQIIADREAEILDLKARLTQQDSQCQADKHVLEIQVTDAQAELDQCQIDLQNTSQELKECDAAPEEAPLIQGQIQADPPTPGGQTDQVLLPVAAGTGSSARSSLGTCDLRKRHPPGWAHRWGAGCNSPGAGDQSEPKPSCSSTHCGLTGPLPLSDAVHRKDE